MSLHFSLSVLNIFRKILLCYTVSQRSSGLWPEPTVQIVHKKKLFFSIVKYTNFWKWCAFISYSAFVAWFLFLLKHCASCCVICASLRQLLRVHPKQLCSLPFGSIRGSHSSTVAEIIMSCSISVSLGRKRNIFSLLNVFLGDSHSFCS